jgi:hypothetical protein
VHCTYSNSSSRYVCFYSYFFATTFSKHYLFSTIVPRPQYILQPAAWTKVLPPHFLAARETALIRAHQYEEENGIISLSSPYHVHQSQHPTSYMDNDPEFYPDNHLHPQHPSYDPTSTVMGYGPSTQNQHVLQPNNPYGQQSHPLYGAKQPQQFGPAVRDMSSSNYVQQHQQHERYNAIYGPNMIQPDHRNYLRNVAEEGAFMDGTVPIDEAIATHAGYHQHHQYQRPGHNQFMSAVENNGGGGGIDPPEDEPPSLRKRGGGAAYGTGSQSVSSADPSMNSPYEATPRMEGPISPQYDQSPTSEFDHDEPIRYNNEEFVDDRNRQYYPPDNRDNQYYNMVPPQQQYHPHDDFENVPNDDFRGNEEYMPDDKFEEQEGDQYDNDIGEYNVRMTHDNVYNEHKYRPNVNHADERPQNYQPHNDEYYDENIDNYNDITPQPSGEPFSDPGDIVYDDNGFPREKDQTTSPTSGSEFSAPTMNDDGFSNGLLYMSTSTDDNIQAPLETTRRGNISSSNIDTTHFPPTSPRSANLSEYSQSPAMRGAQELLRRNRQKRLELAMRMKQQVRQYKDQDNNDDDSHNDNDIPADENRMGFGQNETAHQIHGTNDVISPQSHDSGSTWQTGVSEVTGGSSIWTETESNPDRSSRRALILQMARARMKNQGGNTPNKNQSQSSDMLHTLEEKKLEHIQESSNDIDLPVDLD